ncbi:MAG: hypothetical protein RJQ10_18015 [Haliea sp.]|uniref:hypothetical protein n=1 Tax=Haliea sp. TaxID=1932666 RepID=UPI0032EF3654
MQLILHHYAMSPFAQKIRSMLGYAGLPWQSAIAREMPPRPVVAQRAAGTAAMGRKARQTMSWLDLGRVLLNRINMGRKAELGIAGLREARPLVLAHLAEVESQLQREFLFGTAPSHADFSTWHGLLEGRDSA